MSRPDFVGGATILVVDDDRRVVELLGIALTAYGFRVLQAADGDEAVRVVARERPDLVVLDVRLPKKSGLEVCELLRQDPEDPDLPIVMVSAAAETESRLQGLARGADDYVVKPFSPKELIARIKRLLARSADSREARRRGREAEHALQRARDEARRSHAELVGEQRLREVAQDFARDFHGMLDVERLTTRLLFEAQERLGANMVALLLPEPEGGLRAHAVRGEMFERVAGLRIDPSGDLARMLRGLARPARACDLERVPELEPELRPFVALGAALFAPLVGPQGWLGVLVADDRFDGRDYAAEDRGVLGALCETAALAIGNALCCRGQAETTLEALAALGELPAERSLVRKEAAELLGRAPTLPPPFARLVRRAIELGDPAEDEDRARLLSAWAERDPSGTLAAFERMRAEARGDVDAAAGSAAREASLRVAIGWSYARERERGASPESALAAALVAHAPVEETLGRSLRAALSDRPSLSASRSR